MSGLTEKALGGYRYAVLGGCILLDTVPAEWAQEWLDSAPSAKTLILCGDNPFPKSVQRFLESRPDGVVYAPAYTRYVLEGILGPDGRLQKAADHAVVSAGEVRVELTVASQPGKGAYLIADGGEAGVYAGVLPALQPVEYEKPTVAIAYVSGCDDTEQTAEGIAQGILDSGGLDVRLIDLASTPPERAAAAMAKAAGLLIGVPAVDTRRVWALLAAMSGGQFAGRTAAAFGACTRGEAGLLHIAGRMKQLGLELPDNGFQVQRRPGAGERKGIYEYGYAFGCTLQNKPNTHRSTLVKCLVCGEVFDAALGTCPVCGVGMDKCVPVEEEAVGFSRDSGRAYVIAGGGAAAVAAAEAIRRRDKTGTITLISAEPCLPIQRPMLSKRMAQTAQAPESITLKDWDWFAERQIEIRLGTAVTGVDPDEKRVRLSGGGALPYDRLIWAAGAECLVPSLPGTGLDGVLTVRHLQDVLDLWARLPAARRAVVIGGGVLGLEAAARLKEMRLGVTVLEAAPRIMSRQLDGETCARLTAAAERYGVPILTGVRIAAILGGERVSGVQLEDGTVYPADLVILSCGNRANMEALRDAGAACGRAVQVSARMETTLPDVYACGDCAELDGVNFQLWAEAVEQGRVAGANAAGDRVWYAAISYGASFEGMNTRLYAIGEVQDSDCQLLEIRDGTEDSCRKYWFRDNRLCGGVLYRNVDRMEALTRAFLAGSSSFEVRGQL